MSVTLANHHQKEHIRNQHHNPKSTPNVSFEVFVLFKHSLFVRKSSMQGIIITYLTLISIEGGDKNAIDLYSMSNELMQNTYYCTEFLRIPFTSVSFLLYNCISASLRDVMIMNTYKYDYFFDGF